VLRLFLWGLVKCWQYQDIATIFQPFTIRL